MTVTNKDIYAAAKLYLDKHGEDALSKAMNKITEFEKKGDIEGRECWNQIAYVINWMQNPEQEGREVLQ